MNDSACFICGCSFLQTESQIYYCPTLDRITNLGESHYFKLFMTSEWTDDPQYTNQMNHTIIIAPFSIDWFENGNLIVFDSNANKTIFQDKNVPFDQLPKIYQRFKNLRPFI